MDTNLAKVANGSQQWEEDTFCDAYEATWEISTEQVHYGWLSDGEDVLGLLGDIELSKSNILDIGCGLGQNMIALAKKGANCFGLDISSCMLSKAENLIERERVGLNISLEHGDMRKFEAFEGVEFDVILSVYSMEYLSGVQELRTVVHDIHRRLKAGGVFILCFSHPSQAHRYPELMNCSVPLGAGKYRTYNYSVKDATEALFKCNFSVERVVEQITKNPSAISYEEGVLFPYHFRDGRNPCTPEYDEISNGSPHTIIYKARRQHNALSDEFRRQRSLDIGFRKLWGYKRKIIKHTTISYLGLRFDAQALAPRDNIVGIVDVVNGVVRKDYYDEIAVESVVLSGRDGERVVVNGGSVIGFLHNKLLRLGLDPVYQFYNVDSPDAKGGKEKRVLLVGVVGVDELVKREFATDKIGLLIFVNGVEPASGELPVDMVSVAIGDEITLMYIALRDFGKDREKVQHCLDLE